MRLAVGVTMGSTRRAVAGASVLVIVVVFVIALFRINANLRNERDAATAAYAVARAGQELTAARLAAVAGQLEDLSAELERLRSAPRDDPDRERDLQVLRTRIDEILTALRDTPGSAGPTRTNEGGSPAPTPVPSGRGPRGPSGPPGPPGPPATTPPCAIPELLGVCVASLPPSGTDQHHE